MGRGNIKRNFSGKITVFPVKKPVSGVYFPPGDKSISHRGIFLSSIASGISTLKNLSKCEDVLSSISVFKNLGVDFKSDEDRLLVKSGGMFSFNLKNRELYCGNSGTTARLLLGCLAPSKLGNVLITGDNSLLKRPMERIAEPLKKMGGDIKTTNGKLPAIIYGKKLSGIEYKIDVPSAQVKSGILLASLYADSKSKIVEKYLTREHTEEMLSHLGVEIYKNGLEIEIYPLSKDLNGFNLDVPGDISSASFFIALSLLIPDSHLLIKDVTLDRGRIGFLKVLDRMGAKIKVFKKFDGVFKRGDVEVWHSSLKSTEVFQEEIPSMIDEIPLLSLLMAGANGKSRIYGLSELKYKESNRLKAICDVLNRCGCNFSLNDDDLTIYGPNEFKGFNLISYDHRILMMGIAATLLSKERCVIEDVDFIKISYPEFFEDLCKLIPDVKIEG